MARVYQDAVAVLVLDSGLYGSSCRVPVEGTLMRVQCSRWMRRLWTFQEGVLHHRLFVQFSDGTLNVAEVVKDLEIKAETYSDTYEDSWDIMIDTFRFLHSLPKFMGLSGAR
jgi:hypothetical protein